MVVELTLLFLAHRQDAKLYLHCRFLHTTAEQLTCGFLTHVSKCPPLFRLKMSKGSGRLNTDLQSLVVSESSWQIASY